MSVTGGLSPISYQWSNGAITSSLYNLCPGIYTLIVSNAFCINDSLFDTIVIASTFQSSAHIISNVTCFDSCNAIAQAQASGGVMVQQQPTTINFVQTLLLLQLQIMWVVKLLIPFLFINLCL